MPKEATPKKVLKRAAKVIERGWTQRALAKDDLGQRVLPESENAVCWCAYGAIDRAAVELGVDVESEVALNAESLASSLAWERYRTSLPGFNDRVAKSGEEVAKLLKDAAKKA